MLNTACEMNRLFNRLLWTCLACCIALAGTAQKQANVWHFGDSLQLDFSSGGPVMVPGSSISTFEGSASYCDEFGSFLFYTNGGGREAALSGQDEGHIWDRNNAEMYNMHGVEGGGFSSAQSAVIFAVPRTDSVYYVFTMDEIEHYIGASPATQAAQPVGRGLRYYKVDMRLRGGLGDVVLRDEPVEEPSFEGLCAVRHGNGVDYWILINQDTSTNGPTITENIGVYLVNSTGVYLNSIFPNAGGAPIKASPDGSKIATERFLLDFDNLAGNLSNPLTFTPPHTEHEFSPNSRYLYVNRNMSGQQYAIYRYDLHAANVLASESLVANLTALGFTGQMQLAPDGKIYFTHNQFVPGHWAIHSINCPNTANATIEEDIFAIGGFGLPNFPAWLFENYDSTFVSLSPDTIDLALFGGSYVLNAGNPGATYVWSTGATTQSITVQQPGNYAVTVTGPCGLGQDSIVVINTPTVGITRPAQGNRLLAYPNPTTDQVVIRVPEALIDVPYALHDPQGRIVATGILGATDTRLDLSQLPAGIYLLRPASAIAEGICIQKR